MGEDPRIGNNKPLEIGIREIDQFGKSYEIGFQGLVNIYPKDVRITGDNGLNVGISESFLFEEMPDRVGVQRDRAGATEQFEGAGSLLRGEPK